MEDKVPNLSDICKILNFTNPPAEL